MTPRFISTLLCCFIAGVGIGSLYNIPSFLVWVFLVAGALFSVSIMMLSVRVFNGRGKKARVGGVTIFCVVLGLVLGYFYVGKSFSGNEYEKYLDQSIETEGVVATDPVMSGRNQIVTLLPDGYTQYMRASLYTPIPGLAQGDRVWIRGQLQLPENFSEFDYVGYLQRWQVYAELKKPRVIVLHRAPWNWRVPLIAVRNFVVEQGKVFPEREGSLIIGMLIGQKQNIPDEVAQAFKTTGLTHIVAVSGFNMTVIATACGALVWYIGRRATNILIVVVVVAFVVVTGATAAVVRAAIMAIIMVVAQLLGRQYASLYALLLVSAIMVLLNPRIVVWDIGFQLSAAATFGVLIAFRIKDPEKEDSYLVDMLRPTMGAIIVTAPIIILQFHTFSVIAPLANLLVLPFVTWVMLFGALALVPVIGNVFVLPAQLLTTTILFITEHLAAIPHASVNVFLPAWVILIYYFLIILYIHNRLQKRAKHDKLEKIIPNIL
ncbi:MAG TPA: ComEC/Rec2 family competence protein [Patescibacteria group bacterium]|nr:ComEC/Rec2 family competence protein [Patescibacteria group bacterium]